MRGFDNPRRMRFNDEHETWVYIDRDYDRAASGDGFVPRDLWVCFS